MVSLKEAGVVVAGGAPLTVLGRRQPYPSDHILTVENSKLMGHIAEVEGEAAVACPVLEEDTSLWIPIRMRV